MEKTSYLLLRVCRKGAEWIGSNHLWGFLVALRRQSSTNRTFREASQERGSQQKCVTFRVNPSHQRAAPDAPQRILESHLRRMLSRATAEVKAWMASRGAASKGVFRRFALGPTLVRPSFLVQMSLSE